MAGSGGPAARDRTGPRRRNPGTRTGARARGEPAGARHGTGVGPRTAVLAAAARAVAAVAAGRSADFVLAQADADRAVRAVTLGTVRWYLRLKPAVESLLTRQHLPQPELAALLVAAAHQIEYSRDPPQLIVDAAVDAARALGAPRAAGLVNAVLRRFAAQGRDLLARLDADPAVRSAHPAWLRAAVSSAWPGRADAILAADNGHPPLTLRVDLTRGSVAGYLERLARAGIPARALPWSATAVVLDEPLPVTAVPGFAEGLVSVQDAGAQLAAPLLAAAAGMRVLDACAAPGGKTLHLLECTPDLGALVAVDADAQRLERVRENLVRAGREARLLAADLRRPCPELAAMGPFDRILLDAPCSATGVIRRHPDIKLLRREQDIGACAELQRAILAQCLRLLRPGGRLLYCTCSLLPAENEQVVGGVLAGEEGRWAMPVALPQALLPPGAVARTVGMQLLPGDEADTDGFYYACLEQRPAGR